MESLEERLVSSWFNVNSSVPPSYVQPLECRPSKITSNSTKTIPVIDLGGLDRVDIMKNILEASEEYGFFQVNSNSLQFSLGITIYTFHFC